MVTAVRFHPRHGGRTRLCAQGVGDSESHDWAEDTVLCQPEHKDWTIPGGKEMHRAGVSSVTGHC